MDETTISPAVITSTAADKHINETIKPALAEATAGMQTQKATQATQDTTTATTGNPQAPSTTAGQPLNTYTYIANDGTSKTTQGATPQEAMANAKDIAAHSGVSAVPTPPAPTATETTQTTTEVSPENTAITTAQKEQAAAQAEYQKQAKQTQKTIDGIQNGTIPLNPGQIAQVEGLKASYQTLIDNTTLANKSASGLANVRGYQKGAAEYDPMFQVKTINSIITKGTQNVADLNVKMASAVASLTEAFKSNNIAVVKEQWDIFKEASKERTDSIQKTIESAQNAIKAAQDAYQKEQDKITDIAKSAAESGADRETIASILASGSVSEAVYNAGDSLQKGTGTVGEYLFYKKEAIRNGQVPLSFNEYATMDANRKRSIVNVGVGGLTNQQAQLATKLSDDYEQRSTDFYKLRAGYNQVVSSANDPTGAGDISLLYGYMKMLDPNSVVRETEFATAQNAGSIPENIRAKYNAAVNGKKLSDAQRNDFVNQANKVYTSAQKQQNEVKKEFDDRATKYGVPADLVTRSTDATGGTGGEIIKTMAQAKTTIDSYVKEHPIEAMAIANLYKTPGTTDQDVYDYLKLAGKVQ